MARRLFVLEGTVTLVLELPPPPPPPRRPPPAEISVREVGRDEVAGGLLGELAAGTVEEIDEAALAPWRCFAAFDGARPVHHSFVALREPTALLFRVFTAEDRRGRGLFAATVAHVGEVLAREGHVALRSSTARTERTSLAAHRAAGFRVVETRFAPILLGIDLRALAKRLLSPLLRKRVTSVLAGPVSTDPSTRVTVRSGTGTGTGTGTEQSG